jgi:hypothetical protein
MTIPSGAVVPVRAIGTAETITGPRAAYWRIDLLDNHEAPLGTLDGVTGGSLDWVANATIKGTGTLNMRDTGQNVDWLNVRIRPVYVLNSTTEWPRSIFMPSIPEANWSDTGRFWSVSLLEKATVLDQDKVDGTYALDVGANVINAVRTLITGAGESAGAITDSTATLSAPQVWEPGTPKLTIVNDVLRSAGYFSLYVDMLGQLRAEAYVKPANRPTLYELLDNAASVYGPNFKRLEDVFGIPNKVVMRSQGTGAAAALTSTVTNTDPTSPYSYAARGRWIVDSPTPVNATDQTALDTMAARRLIDMTSVTATVEIEHAPLVDAAVNNAVRFRNTPAGVDARHIITGTHLTIDDGTGLAKSTLLQVVNL